MRSWRKPAAGLAVTAWLGLWPGHAGAGVPADNSPVSGGNYPPTETAVDSLVWYIEELEHDLAVSGIRAEARQDSLKITCDLLTERLAWAEEDRRRWFQDPRLWFLAGCAAATLVMAGSLQVAF
jgi:hypothetical protein